MIVVKIIEIIQKIVAQFISKISWGHLFLLAVCISVTSIKNHLDSLKLQLRVSLVGVFDKFICFSSILFKILSVIFISSFFISFADIRLSKPFKSIFLNNSISDGDTKLNNWRCKHISVKIHNIAYKSMKISLVDITRIYPLLHDKDNAIVKNSLVWLGKIVNFMLLSSVVCYSMVSKKVSQSTSL